MFCAYWLFLAAVETVKVVRLNVLDEVIPNKAASPFYPASDQLLDNAVMVRVFPFNPDSNLLFSPSPTYLLE